MRKSLHNLYVFACTLLCVALLCNGCGFISILATPTRHEKKVPAEYDLRNHRHEKMLVLVKQPGWLDAQTNMRYYLTDAIHTRLVKKIKISAMYLVPYSELSEFRSKQPDSSLLSPRDVGRALGASVVLFVTVDRYELSRMAETEYYKGFLSIRSNLHEVRTGKKLWPEGARSERIMVGFEVESGGQKAAIDRLADAVAHCTVRYFYDCPEDEFKIRDERSDIGWGS
ncbi:MAG: hypothetical protein ACYS21_01160 [Planctomycetota bacterium]|jgi:hypothetical protein